MERLTERYGCNGVKLVNEEEYAPMVAQCLAMHKLAAYEDTNLAPEEIPRWIPVGERMPEPGDCNKNGDVLAYTSDHEVWIEGIAGFPPMVEDGAITHWMPLPQPPKEENDG